jgi:hypothetical protein
MVNEKEAVPCRTAPSCSVFARQEERGHAAIGLGDDPDGIFAEPLARLLWVDGIGGENASVIRQGCFVAGGILRSDKAPIAARVTGKAFGEIRG